MASPHLELAGKANSLWMHRRSVTVCDGSHILPELSRPRGCGFLASQYACNCAEYCYSPSAQGLAVITSSNGWELSSQNRMLKHMHTSPEQSRFSSRGLSLSSEKALGTCILQTHWFKILSLLKPIFLFYPQVLNLVLLKRLVETIQTCTSEMGYVLAEENKLGYLLWASLSWI